MAQRSEQAGGVGPARPPDVAGSPLRGAYRARLDEIDDELVGGALLVAEGLPRICRGLLLAERSCLGEARVLADEVRERCRRVEEQGFVLLAREAPVAGDLRRLVALLRLVGDVERSGRLARHVAEGVERVDARLLPEEIRRQIEELAARSLAVFRAGVDAWRRRDALAVHELDARDAEVDRLRTGLLVQATGLRDAAGEVLALGLIARYFERLADHGVAFAQHVTFVVTGDRVDLGT